MDDPWIMIATGVGAIGLAIVSPYVRFVLTLSVATTPFVVLGGLVAHLLPALPLFSAVTLVALGTAAGAVMMAKCHPEMEQEEWMRPYKIGYFILIVIAAACCQKIYAPDMKLLQALSVPMYMMAGKVFFRLKYG